MESIRAIYEKAVVDIKLISNTNTRIEVWKLFSGQD